MTLEEMASAIRNNIGNGLKEVDDFAYSLQQIKEEIGNVRNQIILEDSKTGVLNPEYFAQRQDNLKLEMVRFPYGGHSSTYDVVPHVKIPKIAMTTDHSAIIYLGPPDFTLDIKRYYDHSFNTHSYSRVIGNRPYAFVDPAHDANGYNDVYIFGLTNAAMREVSIRAIFADPVAILEADGVFGEDEEFPAPAAVQQLIIKRITEDYVRYYKQLNHPYQPNTNTDLR